MVPYPFQATGSGRIGKALVKSRPTSSRLSHLPKRTGTIYEPGALFWDRIVVGILALHEFFLLPASIPASEGTRCQRWLCLIGDVSPTLPPRRQRSTLRPNMPPLVPVEFKPAASAATRQELEHPQEGLPPSRKRAAESVQSHKRQIRPGHLTSAACSSRWRPWLPAA